MLDKINFLIKSTWKYMWYCTNCKFSPNCALSYNYYCYYYLGHNVRNEGELLSINLRDPLSMEFPIEKCNLLLRNKMLLRKYGISLGSSKENTLLIRTIPQCLVTNSDPCNSKKILPKLHSLLNDVLKNRNTSQTNALPLTIHNAIASEACHGIRQIIYTP